MNRSAPSNWLTAAEIAERRLPGLPADKRSVNALAIQEGWSERRADDGTPLARRRAARGGGHEYHASLLPDLAQEVLARSTLVTANAANDPGNSDVEIWLWFEKQPSTIKDKASQRLTILLAIEAAIAAGVKRTKAVQAAARQYHVSPRAIADWTALVARIDRSNWLPCLAPQYQGGGKSIDIDAEAWTILKSDWLRPEKPSFAACYNRLVECYARPRGIELPSRKTLQRRLQSEVGKELQIAKREGREALRRIVPPQRRHVGDLHAMQAVNVDGHTFDVFVQWEDGRIDRPVMVGIQDIYSRKLLSYRIGETENTILTRLAFADLFRDHGIPSEAVLDNGRAFASKALTGGAKTRFRFKIKDTDPTGVLTALSVNVHWTLPYRGSSKPIERCWRDLCEEIAKHPAVSGAYTGNKPGAKPENYRERAIPIAEFRAHVARCIAAHNARNGRRTETANGRSFDDTFAASYALSPVGRASPAQLRLALLEAQDRRCDRANGSVTLAGNRYWSAEMINLAGQKVSVRFDPDNLHSEVHIYLANGTYFGAAQVIERTGFFDKSGAERRSKLEASARRKVKAAEIAEELLQRDRLAELLSAETDPIPPVQPGAARMVRHRGQTAAALKRADPIAQDNIEPDFIDNFTKAVRLRAVE